MKKEISDMDDELRPEYNLSQLLKGGIRGKYNVKFAVCVQNAGCDDLQLRKIYQVLPDEVAAEDGTIRVIDDSGEDYLYPADNFIPVALPQAIERAILETSAVLA